MRNKGSMLATIVAASFVLSGCATPWSIANAPLKEDGTPTGLQYPAANADMGTLLTYAAKLQIAYGDEAAMYRRDADLLRFSLLASALTAGAGAAFSPDKADYVTGAALGSGTGYAAGDTFAVAARANAYSTAARQLACIVDATRIADLGEPGRTGGQAGSHRVMFSDNFSAQSSSAQSTVMSEISSDQIGAFVEAFAALSDRISEVTHSARGDVDGAIRGVIQRADDKMDGNLPDYDKLVHTITHAAAQSDKTEGNKATLKALLSMAQTSYNAKAANVVAPATDSETKDTQRQKSVAFAATVEFAKTLADTALDLDKFEAALAGCALR